MKRRDGSYRFTSETARGERRDDLFVPPEPVAEAVPAQIGTVVSGDVNWLAALSAGGFGFATAILLALTGLPEAEEK